MDEGEGTVNLLYITKRSASSSIDNTWLNNLDTNREEHNKSVGHCFDPTYTARLAQSRSFLYSIHGSVIVWVCALETPGPPQTP